VILRTLVGRITKQIINIIYIYGKISQLMRITNPNITELKDNQIFVFGSNLSGKHGRGAAKTALSWGAKWGQAKGLQGKTYGIPTKDASVTRTLSINEIAPFVDDFIEFAKNNKNLDFLVTEVGCGLAGINPKEIAPLFKDAKELENVWLPERFINKM
jgi:hypothetical protein